MFIFISITTVNGMDLENLMSQLKIAKEKLIIAEKILKNKNEDAFLVYQKYPFMPESLYAEIYIRNNYPEEYENYLNAKCALEDIKYMIYTGNFNMISKLGDRK